MPTTWKDVGEKFDSLAGDNAINGIGAPYLANLKGKTVAVEFSRLSDGDYLRNQAGVHFSKIADYRREGTRVYLKLATGLRFPFSRPKFSLVEAAQVPKSSQQFSADRRKLVIKGNAEAVKFVQGLSANSIVRLENLTGTDSVFGDLGRDSNFRTAYFEYNKVLSVTRTADSATIVFDSPVAYQYGDLWLVNAAFSQWNHRFWS